MLMACSSGQTATCEQAFSSVPYERGFQFLYFLELQVGVELFEPFLRLWVETVSSPTRSGIHHCGAKLTSAPDTQQHKFKSVASDDFKAFFLAHFESKVAADKLAAIDWEAWFHQPGMPPVELLSKFDASLATNAAALAEKWKDHSYSPASNEIQGWSSPEIGTRER